MYARILISLTVAAPLVAGAQESTEPTSKYSTVTYQVPARYAQQNLVDSISSWVGDELWDEPADLQEREGKLVVRQSARGHAAMRAVMAALKQGPKSVAYWRKRSTQRKKLLAKRRKAAVAALSKPDRAVHDALQAKVPTALKRARFTQALQTLCGEKKIKLVLHAAARELLAQGEPRVSVEAGLPLHRALDSMLSEAFEGEVAWRIEKGALLVHRAAPARPTLRIYDVSAILRRLKKAGGPTHLLERIEAGLTASEAEGSMTFAGGMLFVHNTERGHAGVLDLLEGLSGPGSKRVKKP